MVEPNKCIKCGGIKRNKKKLCYKCGDRHHFYTKRAKAQKEAFSKIEVWEKRNFMVSLQELFELGDIYDTLGGNTNDIKTDAEPKEQFEHMWKFCYEKYKIRKNTLLNNNI